MSLSVNEINSIGDFIKILFVSKSSLLSPNSKIFVIVESLCLDNGSTYLTYLVKQGFSGTMMIWAAKEEKSCCFNFLTVKTHWGYTVLNIVPEFVVS